MSAVMTTEERCETLVQLIRSFRYTYTDEYGLQASIAAVLTEAGYTPTREKHIPRIGRLDLSVGRIAIEVKVFGSVPTVMRQVGRYLGSNEIDGAVIVSTVARHGAVPAVIKGKPVRTALLLGDLQ
jgi:hypothetical protein